MSCTEECNKRSSGCDPCGPCKPARYGCDFEIMANPYDKSIWNVRINGAVSKVKIPPIYETDTTLSASFNKKALVYDSEKHQDVITGDKIGSLINLADLRDVEADNPDNCSMLMWNPGCSVCGDGCTPKSAAWRLWHIPDATDDDIIEPDSNGYYHTLGKNDCGCIVERKMPVIPTGMTAINYVRDSVPDDPDFPWYYGQYNDTINLYLAQNAPQYFGKYALKVTVNYGIQCIKSSVSPNVNFRSLVVPVITGQTINVEREASILQANATYSSNPEIPWGSQTLRSSFVFIVPKGKEAYLHHEFRFRTNDSFPNYAPANALDGQRVPDAETVTPNLLRYVGSRLNALQVIVEPTMGNSNFNPVIDAERSQLDPPVDEYPTL